MPSKFTVALGQPIDAQVRVLGHSQAAGAWAGAAGNAANQAVTAAVQAARTLCLRTLGHIDGGTGNVAAWAEPYFLLDAIGYAQQRATIRGIVQATCTGLHGQNQIKVDRLGEYGARGFVHNRPLPDDGDVELAALDGRTLYANSTTIAVHRESGGTWQRVVSSIHVSSYLMDKPLGLVQTIIHEATHRFAGTHDATVDGLERGYIRDGTEWVREGITPELALYNADSYAWFVVKVGNAYDGLIPGVAV